MLIREIIWELDERALQFGGRNEASVEGPVTALSKVIDVTDAGIMR